jgi:hypothetical protein
VEVTTMRDRDEFLALMNAYVDATEKLYRSLGLAAHGDTGEVVAFTTAGTAEAMRRLHDASQAIAVARGGAAPPVRS